MFTKAELIDAINELEEGKHSVQNCAKLAAIYTVLDHLYPSDLQINKMYSGDGQVQEAQRKIGKYGDSNFLEAVSNKNPEEVWLLLDELMSTIQMLNPKLYNSVMARLYDIH